MSAASPSNPLSPDDALPPVQPPSAGFLVQLFVIPGVIVAIIVVVWLLFHWLAQMGNDPREYIRKLRGNNEVRWQAAVNLAGALHGTAGEEIKRNSHMAAELGRILDDEIDAGSMEERPISLRIYLCRALGEFQVEGALPPLLRAATTERSEAEVDVRRAAVHGIASLVWNMSRGSETPFRSVSKAELIRALVAAANSEHDLLRAESAFALGVIDDPKAREQLEAMLDDPFPDARFNAATGLARRGEASALPVLLEMLAPDQALATKGEREENRTEKRKMVNVAGLRAVDQLAVANSDIDLTKTQAAVGQLVNSDIPEVRENATAVRERLNRRVQATTN